MTSWSFRSTDDDNNDDNDNDNDDDCTDADDDADDDDDDDNDDDDDDDDDDAGNDNDGDSCSNDEDANGALSSGLWNSRTAGCFRVQWLDMGGVGPRSSRRRLLYKVSDNMPSRFICTNGAHLPVTTINMPTRAHTLQIIVKRMRPTATQLVMITLPAVGGWEDLSSGQCWQCPCCELDPHHPELSKVAILSSVGSNWLSLQL